MRPLDVAYNSISAWRCQVFWHAIIGCRPGNLDTLHPGSILWRLPQAEAKSFSEARPLKAPSEPGVHCNHTERLVGSRTQCLGWHTTWLTQ